MDIRERRRALMAKHRPDLLPGYDAASPDVRDAMDRCCELMEEVERLGPWSLDLDSDEQRDALCDLVGTLAGAVRGDTHGRTT
jgi:hypothetical protein